MDGSDLGFKFLVGKNNYIWMNTEKMSEVRHQAELHTFSNNFDANFCRIVLSRT